MNNTAKQLVEQLGDSQKITIMADVVHGLDFEYRQLQQENEELKKQVEIKNSGYMASIEEVCEYATTLVEFEKWLEEEKKTAQKEWLISEYHRGILAEVKNVLDKLQELKEGKK